MFPQYYQQIGYSTQRGGTVHVSCLLRCVCPTICDKVCVKEMTWTLVCLARIDVMDRSTHTHKQLRVFNRPFIFVFFPVMWISDLFMVVVLYPKYILLSDSVINISLLVSYFLISSSLSTLAILSLSRFSSFSLCASFNIIFCLVSWQY